MPAEHRPASAPVFGERRREAARDLGGDFHEVQLTAGARRALDLQAIAVVAVQLDQPAEDHQVHREPHRSAPVGVAPEHPGVGLGGQVMDVVLLAAPVEHDGVLEVTAGDRADSMRPEELVLVEHDREYPAEAILVDQ